jgi:DNA-binding beta-propeller fold protein YncE
MLLLAGLLLSLGLLLGACESSVKQPPEWADRERPVWPEAPAEPRMGFVMSFSGPEDLGISKGFMQRLAEFLTGPDDPRLIRPMAVAVGPQDVIYVADPGAKGVHRFDRQSGRYHLIRREGGQPLPSPVGLAAGPAGEIYVSDSELSALFVIEDGADVAVAVPLQGLLAKPTGISLNAAGGLIYLVDTGSHQVKVFARDGAFLRSFGRRGADPGEFNFPTMIWRDHEDHLLVADSLNFRIQVFDASGRFLRQFGEVGDGTGRHARPKGVASDQHGHIYVVDSLFHTLQVFDPVGVYLLKVGRQGREWGEFWLPTGIFIDDRDTIYVADSRNRRVQVFRYIGTPPG